MKQLLPLVFFCCLLLACQTTHLHQQNKSGNISKMENPTGCKLEMDTLFPDTMDYLPYQIINLTDSTFTYGDDYTLEQLDSETGQWTHVNTPQSILFILRILHERDTVHEQILNRYLPGRYRVTKKIGKEFYRKEFRLIKTK